MINVSVMKQVIKCAYNAKIHVILISSKTIVLVSLKIIDGKSPAVDSRANFKRIFGFVGSLICWDFVSNAQHLFHSCYFHSNRNLITFVLKYLT